MDLLGSGSSSPSQAFKGCNPIWHDECNLKRDHQPEPPVKLLLNSWLKKPEAISNIIFGHSEVICQEALNNESTVSILEEGTYHHLLCDMGQIITTSLQSHQYLRRVFVKHFKIVKPKTTDLTDTESQSWLGFCVALQAWFVSNKSFSRLIYWIIYKDPGAESQYFTKPKY